MEKLHSVHLSLAKSSPYELVAEYQTITIAKTMWDFDEKQLAVLNSMIDIIKAKMFELWANNKKLFSKILGEDIYELMRKEGLL